MIDVWVTGIFLSATMVSAVTIIVIIFWERHRVIVKRKQTEKEVQNIIRLQKIAEDNKPELLRKWQ